MEIRREMRITDALQQTGNSHINQSHQRHPDDQGITFVDNENHAELSQNPAYEADE
jgi:hypothetical protein